MVVRFADGSMVAQDDLDRLAVLIDGACEDDPGEEGEAEAMSKLARYGTATTEDRARARQIGRALAEGMGSVSSCRHDGGGWHWQGSVETGCVHVDADPFGMVTISHRGHGIVVRPDGSVEVGGKGAVAHGVLELALRALAVQIERAGRSREET